MTTPTIEEQIERLMQQAGALRSGAIFGLTVFVYPGRMDFRSHANAGNGWGETKRAMQRVRTEIDRILIEGPLQCPYSPVRRKVRRSFLCWIGFHDKGRQHKKFAETCGAPTFECPRCHRLVRF